MVNSDSVYIYQIVKLNLIKIIQIEVVNNIIVLYYMHLNRINHTWSYLKLYIIITKIQNWVSANKAQSKLKIIKTIKNAKLVPKENSESNK